MFTEPLKPGFASVPGFGVVEVFEEVGGVEWDDFTATAAAADGGWEDESGTRDGSGGEEAEGEAEEGVVVRIPER